MLASWGRCLWVLQQQQGQEVAVAPGVVVLQQTQIELCAVAFCCRGNIIFHNI
jgi:hypothetical protein